MSVNEVDILALEPNFQQLIQRFVPNTEKPLIVCYNSSLLFPYFYVITEFSVSRIGIKKTESTIVRFENIVSINETSDFGLIIPEHGIILYGHDSQHAITSFSFPQKNELYFKFAKILRDTYEKIMSSQVSKNKSPSERLREIDSLLAGKLINETEYKRKREEILGDL